MMFEATYALYKKLTYPRMMLKDNFNFTREKMKWIAEAIMHNTKQSNYQRICLLLLSHNLLAMPRVQALTC